MFLTNVNVQKIEQILQLEKAPALHDHLLFDRVRVSQTQLLFAMYYLPENKILLPIYTICFELFRSERGLRSIPRDRRILYTVQNRWKRNADFHGDLRLPRAPRADVSPEAEEQEGTALERSP